VTGAAADSVLARIAEHVPSGEEILIRVSAELDDDRFYSTRSVVVTEQRVLIVPVGDGPVIEVAVGDLEAVRADALVGGAQLTLERRTLPTVSVPYTGTQSVKFSEVARGIEQLRKGETFLIDPKLDRIAARSATVCCRRRTGCVRPVYVAGRRCGESSDICALTRCERRFWRWPPWR